MNYPWGSVRFAWGIPCPSPLCPYVAPWVSQSVSQSGSDLDIEFLSQLKFDTLNKIVTLYSNYYMVSFFGE